MNKIIADTDDAILINNTLSRIDETLSDLVGSVYELSSFNRQALELVIIHALVGSQRASTETPEAIAIKVCDLVEAIKVEEEKRKQTNLEALDRKYQGS